MTDTKMPWPPWSEALLSPPQPPARTEERAVSLWSAGLPAVCPFSAVRLAFPCFCVICHSSLSLPLPLWRQSLVCLAALADFLPRDCYCYLVKNRPAHVVGFIFPGLLLYSVILLHHSYLPYFKGWQTLASLRFLINKVWLAHSHAHWLQRQNWVVELQQGLRMAKSKIFTI